MHQRRDVPKAETWELAVLFVLLVIGPATIALFWRMGHVASLMAVTTSSAYAPAAVVPIPPAEPSNRIGGVAPAAATQISRTQLIREAATKAASEKAASSFFPCVVPSKGGTRAIAVVATSTRGPCRNLATKPTPLVAWLATGKVQQSQASLCGSKEPHRYVCVFRLKAPCLAGSHSHIRLLLWQIGSVIASLKIEFL